MCVIDFIERIEDINTAIGNVEKYIKLMSGGTSILTETNYKNIIEYLKDYRQCLYHRKVESDFKSDH